MEIVGGILMCIGAALIGAVWFIVTVFREDVVWGIICLIVPIAGLAFVVKHWDEAKRPFLIKIAGLAMIFLGSDLAGN
jgi:hypothetical protein